MASTSAMAGNLADGNVVYGDSCDSSSSASSSLALKRGNKMDAAIKEQWVKDLRSGDFQQGQGVLEKDSEFCCLGVLCYRAAQAGVIERVPSTIGGRVWYGDTQSVLPEEVSAWAGLHVADDPIEYHTAKRGAYVDDKDEERWLTVDNDGHGHSFLRIADTVEKYF